MHHAERKERRTWERASDARLTEHSGRLAGHAWRLSTIECVVDVHIAAHALEHRTG
jgi:hypothetical protein